MSAEASARAAPGTGKSAKNKKRDEQRKRKLERAANPGAFVSADEHKPKRGRSTFEVPAFDAPAPSRPAGVPPPMSMSDEAPVAGRGGGRGGGRGMPAMAARGRGGRGDRSGRGGRGARGGRGGDRACFNCGESGHNQSDCTQPKAERSGSGTCFDFQRGNCRRGDKCRFSHETEERAGGGRDVKGTVEEAPSGFQHLVIIPIYWKQREGERAKVVDVCLAVKAFCGEPFAFASTSLSSWRSAFSAHTALVLTRGAVSALQRRTS